MLGKRTCLVLGYVEATNGVLIFFAVLSVQFIIRHQALTLRWFITMKNHQNCTRLISGIQIIKTPLVATRYSIDRELSLSILQHPDWIDDPVFRPILTKFNRSKTSLGHHKFSPVIHNSIFRVERVPKILWFATRLFTKVHQVNFFLLNTNRSRPNFLYFHLDNIYLGLFFIVQEFLVYFSPGFSPGH